MDLTINIEHPWCREVAERDAMQLRALANMLTTLATELQPQAELHGNLTAVAQSPPPDALTAPAQESKPATKRTRNRKPPAEAKTESDPGVSPGPDEPELTFQHVMGAFGDLQKARGNDAVREVLIAHNAVSPKDGKARVSALPEAKWAEVIAQIRAMLESDEG